VVIDRATQGINRHSCAPREGRGETVTQRSQLTPGATVAEYELVRMIGEGAMGQVWLAKQTSLDRLVALKLVLSGVVHEKTQAMFVREARAGGRLSHTNLVTVYDHGVTEKGLAWIAMEYVPGGRTLADDLSELPDAGDLPESYDRTVAGFVAEIAEAMDSAHVAGVVHRDLKPANILITDENQPKVADFGLARLTDESAITRTSAVMGTIAYMSPEQANPGTEKPDHRSDIFSLGIVLYEMLGLRRPFNGDTPHQVIKKILEQEPVDLANLRSRVPRELGVICGMALEKECDRRYATMADFAADLRRFLGNEPIDARPPGAGRWCWLWIKRHPATSLTSAVASVATIAIAVLGLGMLDSMRDAAEKGVSVMRLSAQRRLSGLIEEADLLWPALPGRAAAYTSWISRARALSRELDGHRAQRSSLRTELRQGHLDLGAKADTAWWIDQLDELILGLEEIDDESTGLAGQGHSALHGWSVPNRLARAEAMDRAFAPGGEYSLRWEQMSVQLKLSSPYDDLELPIQVGLVPLGPDSASGFWEFWHVLSGDEPVRGPDESLVITPETGIVLILLPGGETIVGAQNSFSDAPYFDRAMSRDQLPLQAPPLEVQLEPFFISKYEMTQGQWLRIAGNNPSLHHPGTTYGGHANLLTHPVEGVRWKDACAQLQRQGLRLPGEEEWEYSTRADTESPYWTGVEPESLQYAANTADAGARTVLPQGYDLDTWNDGWAGTAPVGSLDPNGYGLHDVAGNVWEWTLPSRELSGRSTLELFQGVLRGGSWMVPSRWAGSAVRYVAMLDHVREEVGFRPARSIVRPAGGQDE
jgi:serine/threonine protein kinase/formylglycine-generating enzyme required for sulfatase activity